MAVEISASDLHLSSPADDDQVYELISTVIARAALFAPCLLTDALVGSAAQAAKGVLVDVIRRRLRSDGDPLPGTSETVGGRTKSVAAGAAPVVPFWPTEIAELQALCSSLAVTPTTALPVFSFPNVKPWPDGLC